MAYIIPVLASILFFISFVLFLFSGFMKKHLYFFFDPNWANFVIVFRTLSGFVVLAAAPASGSPGLMLFLGAAIIFFAFTIPFMSDERLEAMAEWWLSLSSLMLKLWAILWMLIWFFLGYLALPEDSQIASLISSYLNQVLPFFLGLLRK